jgi:hypothetical protein
MRTTDRRRPHRTIPYDGVLALLVNFGIAVTVGLYACGSHPPTLTPVGTAAYHATQVVKALDVLRDAAIDAEAQTPKLISTDNTRKIVTFHEAAVKAIHASPGGWKPTVVAALAQLQHDILPAEWSRLLPYVSLVKSLIEVTTP